MHFSRKVNCWSLRCSWSIACRRCSNYIFILHLTLGFKILRRQLEGEKGSGVPYITDFTVGSCRFHLLSVKELQWHGCVMGCQFGSSKNGRQGDIPCWHIQFPVVLPNQQVCSNDIIILYVHVDVIYYQSCSRCWGKSRLCIWYQVFVTMCVMNFY